MHCICFFSPISSCILRPAPKTRSCTFIFKFTLACCLCTPRSEEKLDLTGFNSFYLEIRPHQMSRDQQPEVARSCTCRGQILEQDNNSGGWSLRRSNVLRCGWEWNLQHESLLTSACWCYHPLCRSFAHTHTGCNHKQCFFFLHNTLLFSEWILTSCGFQQGFCNINCDCSTSTLKVPESE